MTIRGAIRKVLIRMSGNRHVQRALEYDVFVAQLLMGIGGGSDVDDSGERAFIGSLPQPLDGESLCVFDVGANAGQFLRVTLAVLEGRQVQLHCFEPGADAYRRLVSLGGQKTNVTLNNLALADHVGEMTLHYNQPGSGLASLSKRRLDHFGIEFEGAETVRVQTLDNYCQEKNVNHIHLLKTDVEGHELSVFRGADRMLRERRIDRILFEFGGGNIDSRTYFQDFYYFLHRHGFTQLFRLTPSGYLSPISKYREIDEQFRTTNFVAVRT
jgi:FkbM family methyltransferase